MRGITIKCSSASDIKKLVHNILQKEGYIHVTVDVVKAVGGDKDANKHIVTFTVDGPVPNGDEWFVTDILGKLNNSISSYGEELRLLSYNEHDITNSVKMEKRYEHRCQTS